MTHATTPGKLGFKGKLGFTIGDFALNIYWQSVSLFLLFFYTDAVGLSAGVAGLIYMVASIFDAVTDPVMGAIADRTRTRWGRYRPYLLFGGPFVGIAFLLLYYRPPLEGAGLAIWMLAAHVIFRIAYTVASIPYTSMSARITSSSTERSSLAGGRIIFATLGGFTVAILTLPLARYFADGDLARGFMMAAGVFAVIATLVLPIVFVSTREPPETGEQVRPLGVSGYWRALAHNRALWTMLIAVSTGTVCATALGKSVLYYFKYYIGNEAAASTTLAICAASGLIFVPVWLAAIKRIGKRNAWFAAIGWGLVGLAGFALVDIRTVPLAIAFFLWMQVTTLGLALGFWSILPDTVEYGELKTGHRAESFVFGLGQFFLKVALGLGAGLYGWLLGLAGYQANVPQTVETLANLKLLMVALPALGLIIAGVTMIFHPIRGRMHDEIVEELGRRRQAAAGESPA